VAAGCAWLLRDAPSRYKHRLWVAALIISSLLPVLTSSGFSAREMLDQLRFQPENETSSIHNDLPRGDERRAKLLLASNSQVSRDADRFVRISRNLAAGLLSGYLLFLLYRGLRFYKAWRRTKAILRSANSATLPANTQGLIAKCRAAIGVEETSVLFSTSLPVPITLGSFRPVIILPERVLHGDSDVIKSAVGHELAHVVRRDYLLNLVYEFMYLPFSFHPAAMLMRRKINQTRELCCDDLVAERLLESKVYARSLVQLAGSAPPLGRLASDTTLGIADADILEVRIMALLKRPMISGRRRKTLLLIAACLLLALPCVGAAAFAFHFDVYPQNQTAAGQQEPAQETTQREKRAREEKELRERAANEARERAEREGNAEFQGEELKVKVLREREEREIRAKQQAELVKLAKINMDQAIQIATSQYPGKVLECSLVGEHWESAGKLAKDGEIFYQLLILSADDKSSATHLLVSAIDGRIIKAEKEEER